MAPEVSVQESLIKSADMEDLQAVDVWAVLMTFFVIMNPDQNCPFEKSITDEHGCTGVNVESAFKSCLRKRKPLSFSPKYYDMQSTNYQRLRSLFFDKLEYDAKNRCSIQQISDLLAETGEDIKFFLPLRVSQSTALERSDNRTLQTNDNVESLITTQLPVNDGTTSCSYSLTT